MHAVHKTRYRSSGKKLWFSNPSKMDGRADGKPRNRKVSHIWNVQGFKRLLLPRWVRRGDAIMKTLRYGRINFRCTHYFEVLRYKVFLLLWDFLHLAVSPCTDIHREHAPFTYATHHRYTDTSYGISLRASHASFHKNTRSLSVRAILPGVSELENHSREKPQNWQYGVHYYEISSN